MTAADPTPPSAPVIAPEPPRPGKKAGLLAIAAALAAGLVAWGAGEFNRGRFDPTLTLELSLSNAMFGLARDATVKSAALAYGTFAGLIGLLLGLAGGLASGNLRRGVIGGLAGVIVGAAWSVGASYGLIPHFKANYNPDSEDLVFPMLMHGGIWAGAGLAGGLAFGLGLGGPRRLPRALVGGLVGAWLGTAAFEIIGAFAFATEKTVEPIPEGIGSRGAGYIAVALGVGLLLAASLRERRPKRSA